MQASPGSPCPDGACPSGLVCSPATQTCELHAIDAGRIDTTRVDAPIDGSVDAPPNVPSLLQQRTNYADTAATLSVTFLATPTNGHLLVMIGATPAGSLTSVTGGGATWTLAAASTVNANVEIWYGVSDGSNATVSIARTSNAAPMWLAVSEWDGLSTPAALDGTTFADGVLSPASAGSITTTGPALLLFGVGDGGSNVFGSPTPDAWTLMTGIMGLDTQSEWYRVATAAGTFAPQVTETAHVWDAALVAFRYAP